MSPSDAGPTVVRYQSHNWIGERINYQSDGHRRTCQRARQTADRGYIEKQERAQGNLSDAVDQLAAAVDRLERDAQLFSPQICCLAGGGAVGCERQPNSPGIVTLTLTVDFEVLNQPC